MSCPGALLIDANRAKSGRIARALSAENISSTVECSLKRGRQRLREGEHDVALVCENAARGKIEAFCRRARKDFPTLTIVASLRERTPELEEKLFDAGLDDIVTDREPARNVVKRILVRLRNHVGVCSGRQSIHLGNVIVDFDALRVWKQGVPQSMSRGLARVLRYFVENRGRSISRREAAEALWADSTVDPEGRNLDMQVVKLRRLIERDPKNPVFIQTVHGVGYMLA